MTISRETYEVALDVFLHAKLITQRHPYEQVVVPPPEGKATPESGILP